MDSRICMHAAVFIFQRQKKNIHTVLKMDRFSKTNDVPCIKMKNVSNLMRIYRKFFDFWTQKGQRNSKMKPRIFYVFACLNME